MSYAKLKKNIFKNSLKNIQNKKQLIRAIKEDTKKSLSHVTDKSKGLNHCRNNKTRNLKR